METRETVKLKNGAVELKTAVSATMLSLDHLISSDPISFYELVMRCRDRNHRFFENSVEKLRALSLVQLDGDAHNVVRDVVLSAVTGEGLNLELGSPVDGR